MRIGRTRVLFLTLLVAVAVTVLGPARAGAEEGAAEFFVHAKPTKSIGCAIYDGYPERPEVLCERVTPHYQSKAMLRPDGSVVLCRSHSIRSIRCELGNVGVPAPTYRAGKTITVGRFSCRVLAVGARCTLTATGEGFVLNGRRLRAVGGAAVTWR